MANTFDRTRGNRESQGRECMTRCLKAGREAMIVMLADRLDNSYYLDPRLDFDFSRFWVTEMRQLVEMARPALQDEPLWHALARQCEKLEGWYAAGGSNQHGVLE
jgi:hypothetical protein